MADDAVELAFEGCNKAVDKYHDVMFDRAQKTTQNIKARRGAKKGGVQQRDQQQRPGMERRSSSLPPEYELSRQEEGRAREPGGNRRRQGGYAADKDSSRDQYGGGRERTYVDDYQQEYSVARRQPFQDERGPSRNDQYGGYARSNGFGREASRNQHKDQSRGQSSRGYDDDKGRRPRAESESRQSTKSQGGADSKFKGKAHHIAAAVAGGVAGGVVGHSANSGKGGIKVAIAGALIGAIGAGIADTALERHQKEGEKEKSAWKEKYDKNSYL